MVLVMGEFLSKRQKVFFQRKSCFFVLRKHGRRCVDEIDRLIRRTTTKVEMDPSEVVSGASTIAKIGKIRSLFMFFRGFHGSGHCVRSDGVGPKTLPLLGGNPRVGTGGNVQVDQACDVIADGV